jgi:hypothetical protein
MEHLSTRLLLLCVSTLALSGLNADETPSRIAAVYQSEAATTVTAVLDAQLDLAMRMATERLAVESPVALAPQMVAGQGAHADNLTFVRVLNENGIASAQFLAYPESVVCGWLRDGMRKGRRLS